MTIGNYNPTDPISVRSACEAAFQNGGPRVYVLEAGNGRLRPSSHGVKHTLWLANDGDVVYSRRKVTSKTVGTFYGWRSVAKVAA